MLRERFVIYRDRSFKVAEITAFVPGKVTAKQSRTFMKPSSILAPNCTLELPAMNECYLFAGFFTRKLDTGLAPAILLHPLIEAKQPKEALPPLPGKKASGEKVLVLFPHLQQINEDRSDNLVPLTEQLTPESALFAELMATAKNRAMLLTLADLDSKLANWKSLHEVVQVHPGNANFLLLREVTVTKNPDKPGRKGVLMNYHPATQSVFIRFYGLPFGFWLPLMLREAP